MNIFLETAKVVFRSSYERYSCITISEVKRAHDFKNDRYAFITNTQWICQERRDYAYFFDFGPFGAEMDGRLEAMPQEDRKEQRVMMLLLMAAISEAE